MYSSILRSSQNIAVVTLPLLFLLSPIIGELGRSSFDPKLMKIY